MELWYSNLPLQVLRRFRKYNREEFMFNRKDFLESLTYLELDNLSLAHTPDFLEEAINLVYLDLSNNFISKIDSKWFRESLTNLNLSNNNLSSVDFTEIDIKLLEPITTLFLSGNKLTEPPKGLDRLVNLLELKLADNLIEELPTTFKCPDNLLSLDLSNNKIRSIDLVKGALGRCSTLNLSKNKLTELPKSLKKEKYLRLLELENNEFTDWEFLGTYPKRLTINI